MRTIFGFPAAGALLAGALIAAPVWPANADVEYPWCATYRRDNGTNCGFNTYQQCLATISGVGGSCYRNPAYPGPPAKRRAQPRAD